MYFPILRGKQHELSALKELALVNKFDNFLPVIEPVKKNIKDLLLSIKNLNDKGIKPILILNPNIGEYKDNPNLFYQQLTNNDIKIDFLPCVNLNTPNHIFFFNKFENISILFDEYFELN